MTGCSESSDSTQLSTDREYLAQCGVAGADAYEGGDVEVLIEGVVLEPLPLWIVAATGLLSTAALDGSISLVVKGGELAGARACTAISAVDRDGIGTYSLDR
jgi:hypothetical protein